jgi:hypothetical protein
VFGRLDATKVTAGPIDIELAGSGASVLVTAMDGLPISLSQSLLLSSPSYALRSLPAPGNVQPAATAAQPQSLLNHLM